MRTTQATRMPRAEALFVVRESAKYRRELFNAMREQTYFLAVDVPEVKAVVDLGLKPLTRTEVTVKYRGADGKVARHRVAVTPKQVGSTLAYVFSFGGNWHLWSESSAALEGSQGENEFTQILIAELKELRPKKVYAANFSRLIRSERQGRLLHTTFEETTDILYAGGTQFVFSGSTDAMKMCSLQFGIMVQIASWERDWIVQRLLAGRIAKWRRNEWPFGRRVEPLGYRVDKRSGALVPDPAQRDQVQAMMEALSADAPPTELVRRLDEAGVTTNRTYKKFNRPVLFGELESPLAVVSMFYSYAALYTAGEYLFRVRNVFKGFQSLAGLAVVRHTRNDTDGEHNLGIVDQGEFQMLYRPGVPEGGWAKQEVLDDFAAMALRFAESRVAAGSEPLRPLGKGVKSESDVPELHASMLSLLRATRQDPDWKKQNPPSHARLEVALFSGRTWTVDGERFQVRPQTRSRWNVVRMLRSRPAPAASGALRLDDAPAHPDAMQSEDEVKS
jgi:DNA invertase Pin-like site-specific DNA recombinase